MNHSIEKYISDLLYDNDCVIIMNFGGFVCNQTSAKLDEATGILSPPNKTILFNSQLKENDGLLINHISKTLRIFTFLYLLPLFHMYKHILQQNYFL